MYGTEWGEMTGRQAGKSDRSGVPCRSPTTVRVSPFSTRRCVVLGRLLSDRYPVRERVSGVRLVAAVGSNTAESDSSNT